MFLLPPLLAIAVPSPASGTEPGLCLRGRSRGLLTEWVAPLPLTATSGLLPGPPCGAPDAAVRRVLCGSCWRGESPMPLLNMPAVQHITSSESDLLCNH